MPNFCAQEKSILLRIAGSVQSRKSFPNTNLA